MTTHQTTRKAIAAAYDDWKGCGRTAAHGGAHGMFLRALRSYMRLRGKDDATKPLPGSKTAWSDWRKSDAIVVLSDTQCAAIHGVTKHDLSEHGVFSDNINHTDLVTMTGAPTLRVTGNEPPGEPARTEVSAPRIAFRKSPTVRVTADWETPKAGCGDKDLGALTFGLLEAEICLASPGKVEPLVEEVSAGTDTLAARATGVDLADDPRRPGTWRVTVPDGAEARMLSGSVTLPALGNVWAAEGDEVALSVAASEDAIQTEFTPNAQERASDARRSQIRTHLINALMRSFLTEDRARLVLSQATKCRD